MNLKSRTFINLHCFLQVVEHRPPADWHGRLSTKPHWPSVPSFLLRVPLDSISVYQTMEKWGGFFVLWAQRGRRAQKNSSNIYIGHCWQHFGQSGGRAAPRNCRQWQVWKKPWVSDIQRMLQKVIRAFHQRVKDKSLRLAPDCPQLTTAQREKTVI